MTAISTFIRSFILHTSIHMKYRMSVVLPSAAQQEKWEWKQEILSVFECVQDGEELGQETLGRVNIKHIERAGDEPRACRWWRGHNPQRERWRGIAGEQHREVKREKRKGKRIHFVLKATQRRPTRAAGAFKEQHDASGGRLLGRRRVCSSFRQKHKPLRSAFQLCVRERVLQEVRCVCECMFECTGGQEGVRSAPPCEFCCRGEGPPRHHSPLWDNQEE